MLNTMEGRNKVYRALIDYINSHIGSAEARDAFYAARNGVADLGEAFLNKKIMCREAAALGQVILSEYDLNVNVVVADLSKVGGRHAWIETGGGSTAIDITYWRTLTTPAHYRAVTGATGATTYKFAAPNWLLE
jgi:hypothetical protein